MKLKRSLLLLLLSAYSTTLARSIPETSSEKTSVVKQDTTTTGDTTSSEAVISGNSNKANPVGTKDAPVDGKDGKPHAGPFVETEAERDRKKVIEAGGDKPKPKPISNQGQDLPESHDGVMDDRARPSPKEGTRGTEGGVSEKSSSTLDTKIPDPPKEHPPIPHSEQEKMGGTGSADEATAVEDDDKKMIDKPDDLPEKPHNIPMPEDPAYSKNAPLNNADGPEKSTADTDSHEEDIIQPLHSLVLSFTMIIFSEIGDKTFLVAALMAMRHPRMVVFTAAFSALITMTVLSAVLGHAVPTLIPKSLTNLLAAGLFLVFGLKMLLEARGMSKDEGVGAEMKEVEMELEEKEHQQRRMSRRMSRRESSITPYALESGRGPRKSRSTHSHSRLPSPPDSPPSTSSRESSPFRQSTFSNALAGVNNLCSLLLSPAWVQTFVMTFLGEWGDRSQIATIAMAAGQDYWWVTGGALAGHAMCTAAAVIGGRAIAGRVSLKVVTMGGAIAFLIFGVIYLYEAIY